MNLQSKRIVSGVVVGRGQVSITGPAPRLPQVSDATSSIQSSQAATLVAIAANAAASVSPKAE
jgi:flagella basal body P-ring formation protein FlgA